MHVKVNNLRFYIHFSVWISMQCKYYFVRGKKKGLRCNTKPRDNKEYCGAHKKKGEESKPQQVTKLSNDYLIKDFVTNILKNVKPRSMCEKQTDICVLSLPSQLPPTILLNTQFKWRIGDQKPPTFDHFVIFNKPTQIGIVLQIDQDNLIEPKVAIRATIQTSTDLINFINKFYKKRFNGKTIKLSDYEDAYNNWTATAKKIKIPNYKELIECRAPLYMFLGKCNKFAGFEQDDTDPYVYWLEFVKR